MTSILVTGSAGFIGYHLSASLCQMGFQVIGLDNLNKYYDVQLKKNRLADLQQRFKKQFIFHKVNIANRHQLIKTLKPYKISFIYNLAAQAGVRYSQKYPEKFIQSNIVLFCNLLEFAKHHDALDRFMYASTGGVYGANQNMPFQEDELTESQLSLYTATKKCDEILAKFYATSEQIPTVGFRFFNVYGEWGRPDMALFIFTKNILEGKPLPLFNHGDHQRDFTHQSDLVWVLSQFTDNKIKLPSLHSIYNISGDRQIELSYVVELVEKYTGLKAKKKLLPFQKGDIKASKSDINRLEKLIGYKPKMSYEEGVKKFINWYQSYYC